MPDQNANREKGKGGMTNPQGRTGENLRDEQGPEGYSEMGRKGGESEGGSSFRSETNKKPGQKFGGGSQGGSSGQDR